MQQVNQTPNQAGKLEARYRIQFIVWLALISNVGMFLLIINLIEAPPANADNMMMAWVLLALGIFALALSFILKRKFLSQAIDQGRPEMVQTGLFVALALCEVSALCGLVVFFVTGTKYYYIFFIISVLGMLLHMPRREHLRAASFKDGGHGFTMQ